MGIIIYDTLSGQKKKFKPRLGNKVNMFVCGPTVYDFAHIGHARSYITFDIIARYLKWKGYDVTYIQNISDIANQITNKAKELKTTPEEVARKFEQLYYEDMEKLNIKLVTKYCRASDYVDEIVNQVKVLMKKGFAYKLKEGIYFDISKVKDYGKLSKKDKLEELINKEVEPNPKKKNLGDFSLWRFHVPGNLCWGTPLGAGRPGWHITDTAITEKHFGVQYDIHGGGRDLIWPHHEAEIAQMKAYSNKKPLANYWIHNELLLINNEKMSKSLNNIITIRDVLEKYKPQTLRMFFFLTHYREKINYSGNLKEIENKYNDLKEFVTDLKKSKFPANREPNSKLYDLFKGVKQKFEGAMDDDFNMPLALETIFGFVSDIKKLIGEDKLDSEGAKRVYEQMLDFDKILGMDLANI